jgi:hypothetical protein
MLFAADEEKGMLSSGIAKRSVSWGKEGPAGKIDSLRKKANFSG